MQPLFGMCDGFVPDGWSRAEPSICVAREDHTDSLTLIESRKRKIDFPSEEYVRAERYCTPRKKRKVVLRLVDDLDKVPEEVVPLTGEERVELDKTCYCDSSDDEDERALVDESSPFHIRRHHPGRPPRGNASLLEDPQQVSF